MRHHEQTIISTAFPPYGVSGICRPDTCPKKMSNGKVTDKHRRHPLSLINKRKTGTKTTTSLWKFTIDRANDAWQRSIIATELCVRRLESRDFIVKQTRCLNARSARTYSCGISRRASSKKNSDVPSTRQRKRLPINRRRNPRD
jgi:hypothetical protein